MSHNLSSNTKESFWVAGLQDVPKLVAQKSAVVTSELEVKFGSGTFQHLRPFLKFSSKHVVGIPVMQSRLEILPLLHGGRLDWTYWNDSLAITIADINAP
jgi:hypothetical protein